MPTKSIGRPISRILLKATGLGYEPELTQDNARKAIIEVPSHLLASPDRTKSVLSLIQDTEEDPLDTQAREVADLAIKEKPSSTPRLTEEHNVDPRENHQAHIAHDIVLSHSDDTLGPQVYRGPSSDSSSTVQQVTPVPLAEFIDSTCPHIASSFFVKPLVLPSWSSQEAAGYSGWFTKKIKNDLAWERCVLTSHCS
jgi:hypothetical protein